jgi:sulfatase modifying factor 1
MRLSRVVLLIAVTSAAAPGVGAAAPARRAIRVPAGLYRPLYVDAGKTSMPIQAFLIDRDLVTRGEYLGWRGRGGEARSPGDSRLPMTGVDWHEALAFCRAHGGRLPSLAEWEYVAAASPTSRNAMTDSRFRQALVTAYSGRSAALKSVEQGTVNAYGVRGMHDVVWEWVTDPNDRIASKYHGAAHADGGATVHDMSCAGSSIGAADPRDYPAFLRAAFRSALEDTTRLRTLGFRCAY